MEGQEEEQDVGDGGGERLPRDAWRADLQKANLSAGRA